MSNVVKRGHVNCVCVLSCTSYRASSAALATIHAAVIRRTLPGSSAFDMRNYSTTLVRDPCITRMFSSRATARTECHTTRYTGVYNSLRLVVAKEGCSRCFNRFQRTFADAHFWFQRNFADAHFCFCCL